MMGRVYPFEVLRQNVLALGSVNNFMNQFPVGKPWHWLDLLLEMTVNTPTAGTPATGPVADGLLAFLKAITLQSPRNELFFDSVPGRLGYLITMYASRHGGIPTLDVVPAAPAAGATSATFRALIRIPFTDPDVAVPSDFLLDTLGYSTMNLSVATGNIGDLYTTPNATVITNAKLTIMLGQESLPLASQPHGATGRGVQPDIAKNYLSWKALQPFDPTAVGFMDIPRAADIAYYKLFAMYGAGGGTSTPWNGTPTDLRTKFTDFTLQTDRDYPIKSVLSTWLNSNFQREFAGFSAQLTPNAFWVYRFAQNGSKQAAQYSGDLSELRLTWTLPTSGGPASGDQLALGVKMWRKRVA